MRQATRTRSSFMQFQATNGLSFVPSLRVPNQRIFRLSFALCYQQFDLVAKLQAVSKELRENSPKNSAQVQRVLCRCFAGTKRQSFLSLRTSLECCGGGTCVTSGRWHLGCIALNWGLASKSRAAGSKKKKKQSRYRIVWVIPTHYASPALRVSLFRRTSTHVFLL